MYNKMYKVIYESNYLQWEEEDIRWHKLLKRKSKHQFAYAHGDGIFINQEERILLVNKYLCKAIPVIKVLNSRIFYPIRIKGVFIQLNELNEEEFFKEPNFGALWLIIYTSDMTVDNVIELINHDITSIHSLSYVYATLSKEFEYNHDMSATVIIAKESIEV